MEEYKNTMLISPSEIKASGELDMNVDDSVIAASIRCAQNIYLQDIIGTPLLEALQQLVYNSIIGEEPNINDDDKKQYLTLLDDYIFPALSYKVASEITVRISLKIRNIGVSQNSDTNINGVSLSDIKYLKNTYETYWDSCVDRLVGFLKENRSSFPELDAPCCGQSSINLKYGNIGLWLG